MRLVGKPMRFIARQRPFVELDSVDFPAAQGRLQSSFLPSEG